MQLGIRSPQRTWTFRGFNGVNQFDSVAVDLSAQNKITVAFWLQWAENSNDVHMGLEHTVDAYTNSSFFILPNSLTPPNVVKLLMGKSSVEWSDSIPRPSAGVYHHWIVTFDRATPQNLAWIDGVSQTVTTFLHNPISGNFPNSTLYFMSRAGASLFAEGAMSRFGLWDATVTLSVAQIALLKAGLNPSQVQSSGLLLERYTS